MCNTYNNLIIIEMIVMIGTINLTFEFDEDMYTALTQFFQSSPTHTDLE